MDQSVEGLFEANRRYDHAGSRQDVASFGGLGSQQGCIARDVTSEDASRVAAEGRKDCVADRMVSSTGAFVSGQDREAGRFARRAIDSFRGLQAEDATSLATDGLEQALQSQFAGFADTRLLSEVKSQLQQFHGDRIVFGRWDLVGNGVAFGRRGWCVRGAVRAARGVEVRFDLARFQERGALFSQRDGVFDVGLGLRSGCGDFGSERSRDVVVERIDKRHAAGSDGDLTTGV